MNDKEYEKRIDDVQSVAQYIIDYVCLLDDPTLRRIALTMAYEDAKRIFENNIACHTDYEMSQKLVAMKLTGVIEGTAAHLGVTPGQVAANRFFGDALHQIALFVSSNAERIIACRQIREYPGWIGKDSNDDETLNEGAVTLATLVISNLIDIGIGMEQLREKKGGKEE